jgi:hypothetical protein
MRPIEALAAALLLLVLPAASQAPDTPAEQAANIPVGEWTAMASGRTLTYRIDGALWALEHYYPGSNRVTLQLYDGSCMQGTWDYSDPLYCFHWDGQGTSCFRHVRLGERIVIIESQDGADTSMTQDMTGVTDIPLQCGPAVTS